MPCPFYDTGICKEVHMNLKGCYNPSAWKECPTHQKLKKELPEKRLARKLRYADNIKKIRDKVFFKEVANSKIVLRKKFGYRDEPNLKITLNGEEVLVSALNLSASRGEKTPDLIIWKSNADQVHKKFSQIKSIAIEVE